MKGKKRIQTNIQEKMQGIFFLSRWPPRPCREARRSQEIFMATSCMLAKSILAFNSSDRHTILAAIFFLTLVSPQDYFSFLFYSSTCSKNGCRNNVFAVGRFVRSNVMACSIQSLSNGFSTLSLLLGKCDSSVRVPSLKIKPIDSVVSSLHGTWFVVM